MHLIYGMMLQILFVTRFTQKKAKASIATDLGDYDEYLVEKIYDSDILFVEANHDVNMLQVGRYPYYLKRRILGREDIYRMKDVLN